MMIARSLVTGSLVAGSLVARLMAAGAILVAAASLAEAKPKPKTPPPPPPPPKPTAADFRTPNPDNLLVIDTNKGRIIVELSPNIAPQSAERLRTLAHQHFYDGQSFFRVIDGFMDQTGDPLNTGEGGSKLPNVPGEFTFRRDASTPFVTVAQPDGESIGFVGDMPVASQPQALMSMTKDGKVAAWTMFCPGVVGIARANDPDSANSQFFLMREAYPKLEKQYTAVGRVIVGQDVVRAIKLGEPPTPPMDKMITVRVASDLPPAERPNVKVLDVSSAAFKGIVDAARDEKGADFSICDIAIPALLQ
jgi:peptidylprolyl isomerase